MDQVNKARYKDKRRICSYTASVSHNEFFRRLNIEALEVARTVFCFIIFIIQFHHSSRLFRTLL